MRFHIKHKWSRWLDVPCIISSFFGPSEKIVGQERHCLKCGKRVIRNP